MSNFIELHHVNGKDKMILNSLSINVVYNQPDGSCLIDYSFQSGNELISMVLNVKESYEEIKKILIGDKNNEKNKNQ